MAINVMHVEKAEQLYDQEKKVGPAGNGIASPQPASVPAKRGNVPQGTIKYDEKRYGCPVYFSPVRG